MEKVAFLCVSVLAAIASLLVLTHTMIPRWVRLRRINTQSVARAILPVVVSLGILFFFPSVPPCLANLIVLLFPRKREKLSELDYAMQEADPSILGEPWVSLYHHIARTGKIPASAIRAARGRENTLVAVTTLALLRDEQLIKATRAAFRAAEAKLQAARGQAMSIIAFPYIATVISTIFWLATPRLSPGIMEVGGEIVGLMQVFSVAVAAVGTELVFRALS